MRPTLMLLTTLVLVGSPVIHAQDSRPTAKPASPIASGNASITGRVLDRGTERPIGGALVTLASVDRSRTLVSLTDSAGRYEFASIAAGEYRLKASHADYVAMELGLREVRTAATSRAGVIGVEPNAVKSGIDFSLPRGAPANRLLPRYFTPGGIRRGDARPRADAHRSRHLVSGLRAAAHFRKGGA